MNVAALIGHTALRNNHMDRLDRAATAPEIEAMRSQLQEALDGGALGLSSGLAYLSANSATTEEVLALAQPLAAAGAVYATHMRNETETILDAMREAFEIGAHEPRARDCLSPQVRGHRQLGPQRRGLAGSRIRAASRRLRAAIAIPTRPAPARWTCARWMNASRSRSPGARRTLRSRGKHWRRLPRAGT